MPGAYYVYNILVVSFLQEKLVVIKGQHLNMHHELQSFCQEALCIMVHTIKLIVTVDIPLLDDDVLQMLKSLFQGLIIWDKKRKTRIKQVMV